MPTPHPHDVTRLLAAHKAGDRSALDDLIAIVYDDLRAIAANSLARERPDHTLRPTEIVNEAYLRLVNVDPKFASDRVAFFGLCANVIRRVLVDHAKARNRIKRGGGLVRVDIDVALSESAEHAYDWLELDTALERIAADDPLAAQIAELRIFGELSHVEIAAELGVTLKRVDRRWAVAKRRIARELYGVRGPIAGGGE